VYSGYVQLAKILLLPSKYEIIFLPSKNGIFFNIALAILDFLYCSPFSYRSSNFAIAKVVALKLFA
jgi:hypothetical protein